jgi:hypothetical protein
VTAETLGMAPEPPKTAQDGPKQRERPCVRCGAKSRAPERFCCPSCLADPCLRREMEQARRRSYRNLDQRQWLVAYADWKGGWGRSA